MIVHPMADLRSIPQLYIGAPTNDLIVSYVYPPFRRGMYLLLKYCDICVYSLFTPSLLFILFDILVFEKESIPKAMPHTIGYIEATKLLEPTFPFVLKSKFEQRLSQTPSKSFISMCHHLNDSLAELLIELGFTVVYYSEQSGRKRKKDVVFRVLAAILLMKNNYSVASILYHQLIQQSKGHGWNMFELAATMGLCVCNAHQHQWKNVFATVFHLLIMNAPKDISGFYWNFLLGLSKSTHKVPPLRNDKLIALKGLGCVYCVRRLKDWHKTQSGRYSQQQLSTALSHSMFRHNSMCVCTHLLGQNLEYDIEYSSDLPIPLQFSRAELVFVGGGTGMGKENRDDSGDELVLFMNNVHICGKTSSSHLVFTGFAKTIGVFVPDLVRLIQGSVVVEIEVVWKGSISVVIPPNPVHAAVLSDWTLESLETTNQQGDGVSEDTPQFSPQSLVFFGLKDDQSLHIQLSHNEPTLCTHGISKMQIRNIDDTFGQIQQPSEPSLSLLQPLVQVKLDVELMEETLLLQPFTISETLPNGGEISIQGENESTFMIGQQQQEQHHTCHVLLNASHLVPPTLAISPLACGNCQTVSPHSSSLDLDLVISGDLHPPYSSTAIPFSTSTTTTFVSKSMVHVVYMPRIS
eukprot:m.30961 g.30961  ORF g.30961 m.30961 type:complete len:634 (+) comp9679_c0_seq3:2453-4354(+)